MHDSMEVFGKINDLFGYMSSVKTPNLDEVNMRLGAIEMAASYYFQNELTFCLIDDFLNTIGEIARLGDWPAVFGLLSKFDMYIEALVSTTPRHH